MNEKKLNSKKVLQNDPEVPWQRLVDSNIESMIPTNPTPRKANFNGACSNRKNINRVKESVKHGKDEASKCGQQKSFQINENRENIHTTAESKLSRNEEIGASDQNTEESILLNVADSPKNHENSPPNQIHGSDSINQDPTVKSATTLGEENLTYCNQQALKTYAANASQVDSRCKDRSSIPTTCLSHEDPSMTLSSWHIHNRSGIKSDCERDQESVSSDDDLHETYSSSLDIDDIYHQPHAVNLKRQTQLQEAQDLEHKINKTSFNVENNHIEDLISSENICGDGIKACDVKEYREVIGDTASDYSFLDSMTHISTRDGLVKDDKDGFIDSNAEHIQSAIAPLENASSKRSSSYTSFSRSIVGGKSWEAAKTACSIDQKKFEKNRFIVKARDDMNQKELEVYELHKQSQDKYSKTLEKATYKTDFSGNLTAGESPQVSDEIEQSVRKVPMVSDINATVLLNRVKENPKKKDVNRLQKSDYAKVYTVPLNTSTMAFQHHPCHGTKDPHTESKHVADSNIEITFFNKQNFSERNDAFTYNIDSSYSETRETQCKENNSFGTATTDISSTHLECQKDSDVPFTAEQQFSYHTDSMINISKIHVPEVGCNPKTEIVANQWEVIDDLQKGVTFMSESQAVSRKHENSEPTLNDITKVDFDCYASNDGNYDPIEKGKDVRISVLPTTPSSTIHKDSDSTKEMKRDMCTQAVDLGKNEISKSNIRTHCRISSNDNSLKSNKNTGNSGIGLAKLDLNMTANRAKQSKGEIEHWADSRHFQKKTHNLLDSKIRIINDKEGFGLHESLGRNEALPFSKSIDHEAAAVIKNKVVNRKVKYSQEKEKFPIFDKGLYEYELHTKTEAECDDILDTNKAEQTLTSIKGKNLAQSPSTPWKRLMETNIDSMLNSHHGPPLLDQGKIATDYFCTNRTENHDIQRNDLMKPSESHLEKDVAPFAEVTCFKSNDHFLMSKESFPDKDKNNVSPFMKTFVNAKDQIENSEIDQIPMASNYFYHSHKNSSSDRNYNLFCSVSEKDQKTFSSTSDVRNETNHSLLSFVSETKPKGYLENNPFGFAKTSEFQHEIFLQPPGSQKLMLPTIDSVDINETPYFVETLPSSTHVNTDHISTDGVIQYPENISDLSSEINSFPKYVNHSNHRVCVEGNSHKGNVVSDFSRPKNTLSASYCEQEKNFPETLKPFNNVTKSEFRKDNVKATSASAKEPGKSPLQYNKSALDPQTSTADIIDIEIPSEFSETLTVFGISQTFGSSVKEINNEKHRQVSDGQHEKKGKSGVGCLRKSEKDSAQMHDFPPNTVSLYCECNIATSKSSLPLTKGMYEECEILTRPFSCDNLGKAMPEHHKGENDNCVYVSMSSDSLHLSKKTEPHHGYGDELVRLDQLPFCLKDSDINFQRQVISSKDTSHSNKQALAGIKNVEKEVFKSNIPKKYKDEKNLTTCRDASNPVCRRIPLNKESMENNALMRLLDKSGASEVEYCSSSIARQKGDVLISVPPKRDSPSLRADSAWVHKDETTALSNRASSDEKKKTFEEIKDVSEKAKGNSNSNIEFNFDLTQYPLSLSPHTSKIDFEQPTYETTVRGNAFLKEQHSAYLSNPCICATDKSEFKKDNGQTVPREREVAQSHQLPRDDDIIRYKKWKEDEFHFGFSTKSVDKDKDFNEILHRFDQKEDANELYTNAMTQSNEVVSVKRPESVSVSIEIKNLDHSPTTPWKRLIEANIDSMCDNNHRSPMVNQRPTVDDFYTNSNENRQDKRCNANKSYDPPSKAEVTSFVGCTTLNSTSQFEILVESFLGKDGKLDQQLMKSGFANNKGTESMDQSSTANCFAHENTMEMLSSDNNLNLHDESCEKESKIMPMKETFHETNFWSPGVDSELCQSFVSSVSESEKDEGNKFLLEINKSNLSAGNAEKHDSATVSDYSQRNANADADSENENIAEGYIGFGNDFVEEENVGHTNFIIERSDEDSVEAEVSSTTVKDVSSSALISTEEIETFDSDKTSPVKTCNFARGCSTMYISKGLMQGEPAMLCSESIDIEVKHEERINTSGSIKYSQKFKDIIFCTESEDSSLRQIPMHKLCPVEFSNEGESSKKREDTSSLTSKASVTFRFGELQDTAATRERYFPRKLRSNDIFKISSLPLNLAAMRFANNTKAAKPTLALQRDPHTQWKRLVDSNIESMLLNEACYPRENSASIRPFVRNYANTVISEYLCRQSNSFQEDFSVKFGSGSLPIALEPIKEENNDSIVRDQNIQPFKLFQNDSNVNTQHPDFFIKPRSTEYQENIKEESFLDIRGTNYNEISDSIEQYEHSLSQKLVGDDVWDTLYGNYEEAIASVDIDDIMKDEEFYSVTVKTGNNVFVLNSPGTNSPTLHKDSQQLDENNMFALGSCSSCTEKNEGVEEQIDLYKNQKWEAHSNEDVSLCSPQNSIRLNINIETLDVELTTQDLDPPSKTIKRTGQDEDTFINMNSHPKSISDNAKCQIDQGTCAPFTRVEVTDFFRNSQKENDCLVDNEKCVSNNQERPLTQRFDNRNRIVCLNEYRLEEERDISLSEKERQDLETCSEFFKNKQEMIRKSGAFTKNTVGSGDSANESINFLQCTKKQIPAETSVKILEKNPTTQWKRLMETNIESMLSICHGSHLLNQGTAVSGYTNNTESREVQRIDSINTIDQYSHARAMSPAGKTRFKSSFAIRKQSNCFHGGDENIDYCYHEFKRESSKQVNTVSNRNNGVVDTEENINVKTKENNKYSLSMSRLEMIHTNNELDFASANKKTLFTEENVHFVENDLLEISDKKTDEVVPKVNNYTDLLNEHLYLSDTSPESNLSNTSKLKEAPQIDVLKSLEIPKGDNTTVLAICPSKSCDTSEKICKEEKTEKEHVTMNFDSETDARVKHVINAASPSSQTFYSKRQGYKPNEIPPQTTVKRFPYAGVNSESSIGDGDQACGYFTTNLQADNITLEQLPESNHLADVCQSISENSTKLEPKACDVRSLFTLDNEKLSIIQKGPYQGENKASADSSQSIPMLGCQFQDHHSKFQSKSQVDDSSAIFAIPFQCDTLTDTNDQKISSIGTKRLPSQANIRDLQTRDAKSMYWPKVLLEEEAVHRSIFKKSPKMKCYLHASPINGCKESENSSVHNICSDGFFSDTNSQSSVDKINLDIETPAKKPEKLKSTKTANSKRFSKEINTKDKQIKLFSLLDVVDSYSCISSVTVLPPAPDDILGKYVAPELRENNNKPDVSAIKSYDYTNNPSKKGFLSQGLVVLSNVMKYIFGVSVLQHNPSDDQQIKLQTTARFKRPTDLRCLRDRGGLDKYVTEGEDSARERIVRDAARVAKRRQRRWNAKSRQQTSLSIKSKRKPKQHYENSTQESKGDHVKEANGQKEHVLIMDKPNFSKREELSSAQQIHSSRHPETDKNALGFDFMKHHEIRDFLKNFEIAENSRLFNRPEKQRHFEITMNTYTTPNDQALSEFFRTSEHEVISSSSNQITYSPEVVKIKDIIRTKGTLKGDCQRDIHLKRDELSVIQSQQSRASGAHDSVEDPTDDESEEGTESSGTDVEPSDILRYSLECLLEVVIQRGKIGHAFVANFGGEILAKSYGWDIHRGDVLAIDRSLTSTYPGITKLNVFNERFTCIRCHRGSPSITGTSEGHVLVALRGCNALVVGLGWISLRGSCIREVEELAEVLRHRGL